MYVIGFFYFNIWIYKLKLLTLLLILHLFECMSTQENNLWKDFNRREISAFSEVYTLVFNELYTYTAKVYKNTEVDPNDIIHDLFIHIWNSDAKFENTVNIKAYLYAAIKNKVKNYITHQKHIENYKQELSKEDSYYDMLAVESEFHVLLSEMIAQLPTNYAKIIKLHLDGWDVKSIAEKLDITEKTVYNRKVKAIELLRKSINSNQKYLIVHILFGI